MGMRRIGIPHRVIGSLSHCGSPPPPLGGTGDSSRVRWFNRTTPVRRASLLALFAGLLSACGGGSSDSDSDVLGSVETGAPPEFVRAVDISVYSGEISAAQWMTSAHSFCRCSFYEEIIKTRIFSKFPIRKKITKSIFFNYELIL